MDSSLNTVMFLIPVFKRLDYVNSDNQCDPDFYLPLKIHRRFADVFSLKEHPCLCDVKELSQSLSEVRASPTFIPKRLLEEFYS